MIWEPARSGEAFEPQRNAIVLLRFEDVADARNELESKGIEFEGTVDTGVRRMATFLDPDDNKLVLHRRYAPYREGTMP